MRWDAWARTRQKGRVGARCRRRSPSYKAVQLGRVTLKKMLKSYMQICALWSALRSNKRGFHTCRSLLQLPARASRRKILKYVCKLVPLQHFDCKKVFYTYPSLRLVRCFVLAATYRPSLGAIPRTPNRHKWRSDYVQATTFHRRLIFESQLSS